MSSHSKRSTGIKDLFYKFYLSYIPNKRDNPKQIMIKSLFIVAALVIIASIIYLVNYFTDMSKTNKLIDQSRDVWYESDSTDDGSKENAIKYLLNENSDFMGWVTIEGTPVDNPVYLTDNNDFYINYNQKKEKSAYGALFFECTNTITKLEIDKNLIIYGHQMKNGSMFGTLKKYKSLDYYKEHPTVNLTTIYSEGTYKIFSVFLLNADAKDDNNYMFPVTQRHFAGEDDFSDWTAEAHQRSIIDTGVDVEYGDDILTLITCSSDFKNARFVVMARKVRDGESAEVDVSQATLNPEPRYPKAWYDKKGLEYPF